MRLRIRPSLLLLPGILLAAALPGQAAAQDFPRGPAPAAAPAAAPALPGLAARRPPAPIPADPTASLSPNAALFDAISRGDLAAARDAVARGANIEARNALGLTPLDAAVDQGRNEIAFYLLSARDMSSGGGEPPAGAAPSAPPARPAPRAPLRPLNAPPPAAGTAPAPRATATLWAGDGGAPQPEIGFLGFDAGRPPGAMPPTDRSTRRPAAPRGAAGRGPA